MPTVSTQYRRSPNGSWQVERHIEGNRAIGNNGLEVTGKQSINDPPLLVASKGEISRVIWDPNPQLNNVELSEVIVYTWKDNDGRDVKGGLYKPVHYKQGQRYPLVIQTHGFIAPDMFFPSGTGFPNEFAARQLAAAGFLVLQADVSDPVAVHRHLVATTVRTLYLALLVSPTHARLAFACWPCCFRGCVADVMNRCSCCRC